MSHMKLLQAQIKDLDLLGRVAKKLGAKLIVGKTTIHDFGGNERKVEAKLDIKDGNGKECIGFERDKKDRSYNMIGDTYQLRDQGILNKISRAYSEELVKKEALEEGLVQTRRVEKNGEVHIFFDRP